MISECLGNLTLEDDEMAPHGVQVSVVMPPFTNTELIAGTKNSGAIKPVEPEDIAAAVIKTLEKPKTHVSVPPALRLTAQAAQMLGPRGRRWLNKRLGLDSVFLDFDAEKRRSYEQRAQAARANVVTTNAKRCLMCAPLFATLDSKPIAGTTKHCLSSRPRREEAR